MAVLAPWMVELYRTTAVFRYTNDGFLMRNLVMPPVMVDGKKMYFPKAGRGVATQIDEAGKMKYMNTGRELLELTTTGYEAPEKIKVRDQRLITAPLLETSAMAAAKALGQRHDKAIYDKIHAGAGTYGTVIGAFNAAMTLERLLAARVRLKRKTQSVGGEIILVLPTLAFAQLAAYKHISSSDYNGEHVLSKGVRAHTWSQIHLVEGYDELFPTNGAEGMTAYMFLRDAVGSGDVSMANGMSSSLGEGIATRSFDLPEERAIGIDNTIDVGALVLQSEGIVEIRLWNDPAAAIALN